MRPSNDLMRRPRRLRGELLPGFYDDWVVLEREHLQLVFEKRLSAAIGSAGSGEALA